MPVKISAVAAAYMKSDASPEGKMEAARGNIGVSASDLALLLVFLSRDADRCVGTTACATLENMSETMLLEVCRSTDVHPKVLDVLARLHFSKKEIASLIAAHPNVDPRTADFLRTVTAEPETEPERNTEADALTQSADTGGTSDEWEAAQGEEEFKSKYQLAQVIGISEKIKYAMAGDKEWRSIMLKDSNKLVSGAVLKNPRITEQEILAISKSSMVNEETVRIVCNNKEWIKNYQIRKALVENHRTPLPIALRFLATLTEKDLAMMAKSKNVSTVIATQARKALQALQKRR